LDNNHLTVAVDGPASSGKSTAAKLIAKKLDLIYIDTGAMYRSLTLKALKNNADVKNEIVLDKLLKDTEITFSINSDGKQITNLDGQDVTNHIRSNEVSNSVSAVSAHQAVREEMVRRQQLLAGNKKVIMDGRDIGTVVLPDASVKIFLIADAQERAERRYEENLAKGIESNFDTLLEEIKKRDEFDSNRAVSPLTKAEDAIELDTTKLTIEEVVDRIEEIIKIKQ